ncbi:response regulator [Crocosphaera sp.]|uniref:response regulator n=1 Tax=Crocosphaera sp. TaxID=2729996 RepID=UPI002608BAB9|nr:response regulator [Crocosphaera sp.]MDJ0578792.1 response regulator [Crocosphaera sp.]
MILIVDDEPVRMEVYVNELKLSNYEVELAENIDDALEYFDKRQEEIKLLILDIMMRGGKLSKEKGIERGLRTGIIFYKKIIEENKSLPIIILSNLSKIDDQEIEQEIQNNPKRKFLHKIEILPGQLLAEVKEMLS